MQIRAWDAWSSNVRARGANTPAGSETILGDLALACVSRSLCEGARQRTPNPVDRSEVKLFNPRGDPWFKYFSWNGT